MVSMIYNHRETGVNNYINHNVIGLMVGVSVFLFANDLKFVTLYCYLE